MLCLLFPRLLCENYTKQGEKSSFNPEVSHGQRQNEDGGVPQDEKRPKVLPHQERRSLRKEIAAAALFL